MSREGATPHRNGYETRIGNQLFIVTYENADGRIRKLEFKYNFKGDMLGYKAIDGRQQQIMDEIQSRLPRGAKLKGWSMRNA